MTTQKTASPFPSVDRVARLPRVLDLCEEHGRTAVIEAIRAVLESYRARMSEPDYQIPDEDEIAGQVAARLQQRGSFALRRVFNLTGTVLHTNLGRALLSERAVQHVGMAMREACNLEFDLDSGGRGERDSLIEEVLTELTGAEAATVVNNNAAAVLLVLAALAYEKDVVLSRGELVEIGGAFRIPDVMRSAGARLVEIGTTNRTHPADYQRAIGPNTAALMKVHTSNYKIEGFVTQVSEPEVADIAHAHDLPFLIDLGAGSLIDLTAYGLPKEPIVREVIASGADIVTFSGDKLLGGPQAGLIVGKKALIERIKRHPMKRALRVSKLTLAALEATLLSYRNPEHLLRDIPTLRLLTRPLAEIEALAARLQPVVAAALGAAWRVEVLPARSQVGSGSLPVDVIPSAALAISHHEARSGAALNTLATRLRELPVPVIGRIADNRLLLDLRCLEDEAAFAGQFKQLQQLQPVGNAAASSE
ncbi:L-seryl-tRNA(Sec) selenium transferase [Paraburkholderia sp. DHOC27]|uniref:L-seryl-tRNA(Sec) selenium transferase n=1 Tax=Paraburkholderia sp. DHOC27 TaxID=2303330 RepID=UPI000E3BA2B7|nr:L-seryl-tRNA(Sec) selenium transferase [Paraburkholderia sp. DHOC27]RFU48598.1 L-seryl-tRNA(Sec) selenium transferase [Paraburkholderia sp. DHOC27]